jgi:membrane-associated protein
LGTYAYKLRAMFNINHLIASGGLLLIGALIFGESGMFIGFFFPGDTLVLGAGVFAATGKLSLLGLIIVVSIAAILGDNVGYHIGRRYGHRLFKKKDGILFRQEHVQRAEKFFERFGSKTMLFSHFIAVVRTFAPAVAGVAKMNHKEFFFYDAVGDIAWAVIISLVGYWFGSKIPNIDHYILLAVLVVVLATLGPTLYHLAKAIISNKKKTETINKD